MLVEITNYEYDTINKFRKLKITNLVQFDI